MKKIFLVAVLALALAFGSVASAYAASANYTIVVPRLRADIYTSAKTVSAGKDFGVRHRYSGAYPVRFAVCNSSRQAIGPVVTVNPGGSTAPLVDLWYNDSASSKTVLVRMDSSKLNYVKIVAEGTWYWNY